MPWIVICLIAVLIGGCTQSARYKTLNFFFTGVPSPEQKLEQERIKSAAEFARSSKAKLTQDQLSVTKSDHFLHGPYAAGWCAACHNQSNSQGFRGGENQSIKGTTLGLGQPRSRLVMQKSELCISCHEDKRPAIARKAGLWQHGPVATGMCTACHDPHKSPTRYMLKAKTTEALCTACHEKQSLHATGASKQTETKPKEPKQKEAKQKEAKQKEAKQKEAEPKESAPAKTADCMLCHNPHLGRTALLLKNEFDESNWSGLHQ